MNIAGVSLYFSASYPSMMVVSQDGRGQELNDLAMDTHSTETLSARLDWVAATSDSFGAELLYVEVPAHLLQSERHDNRPMLVRDLEQRLRAPRAQVVPVPSDTIGRLKEYAAWLIADEQLRLENPNLRGAWEALNWTRRESGAWRVETRNLKDGTLAVTDAIAVFARTWYPNRRTVRPTLDLVLL